MATSGINNLTQKFCLEHMKKQSCKNPGCKYYHYERQRVQVISVDSEAGFVVGRLTYIPLCRYYLRGHCRYGNKCRFRHETILTIPPYTPRNSDNMTNTPSTSSSSPENSIIKLEQSKGKTCGICFETVIEKSDGDNRFGILPNCCHCYCISCIYKWRQSTQFDQKIIKACPECRVSSDFVYPSFYWVEKKDEKDRLICEYKRIMSNKDCKHFKKGAGKCPFGNKCFYKHAFPDGRICDVGPPRRRRHRHRLSSVQYMEHIILWNVIGDSDEDLATQEELENLDSFLSDDSEFSEEDLNFVLM